MNICFIMYPWNEIKPADDSSLCLINECALRGHRVAITQASDLTIRESLTMSRCQVLKSAPKVSKNMSTFHKNAEFKTQMLPLAGFDVIFMRDNPPVDNLMLNFLDSVKNDVFIVNDVDGLRRANNKLYTAAFFDPDNEFIPRTHVSKNKDYLLEAIKESEAEKLIMKPLNGFGGSGVIVIEKNATQNIKSLLDFYVSGTQAGGSNYVIVQDYVPGAEKGDVRVLMLHGEPIGAMRRVPAEGEARSNVSAGGHVVKHNLTKDEKRLCKVIGDKLVEDGLYFCGLDIIGGKLIEVNVLSPGGISFINRIIKTRLQTRIVDYLEDMVRYKNTAMHRRQELRNAVTNA